MVAATRSWRSASAAARTSCSGPPAFPSSTTSPTPATRSTRRTSSQRSRGSTRPSADRTRRFRPARSEEAAHGRQRLPRDRGDRRQLGVLGGGSAQRRRDGGEVRPRSADRRGAAPGRHRRRGRGRQLPRPPRDVVQVRVGRVDPGRPASGSLLEPEAHLQRHLVVLDAALVDVAADRDDLEPVEVAQGLGRLGDRAVDRLGDALGGGARDLDGLVDVVGHRGIIPGAAPSVAARGDGRPRQRRARPCRRRVSRPRSARARRGLLHVLLGARGELLAVLLALLLDGLLGALSRLLGDLLAALERLLTGLLGLLLDVVGDRTELAVLDARGGQQEPDDEARGDGADGEPERVLLGDAHGAAGVLLDLLAVRGGLTDAVRRADHLRLDRFLRSHEALLGGLLLVDDRVARARLDVGLVAEGVDRVAHLLAGRLYFPADPVRVFAHWMSSFTVSTVCSGTGGVACCSSLRPRMASTAPISPHRTVTISAASHSGMAVSSAAIRHAVSAPSMSRAATAAPASIPAPRPATLPLVVSSAWASLISWRTSVDV